MNQSITLGDLGVFEEKFAPTVVTGLPWTG